MSESIPQKYCKPCEKYYPATAEFFHKNGKAKDGLCSECKKCNRRRANAYRDAHLEECRAADRARKPKTTTPKEKGYCSGCEKVKPRTSEFFHKRVASPDGLNNLCKECNVKKSGLYKRQKRKTVARTPLSTHCSKGHELTEANKNKRGRCVLCIRESKRLAYAKTHPNMRVKKEEFCVNGHSLVKENLRTGSHAGECLLCHRESSKRRYHKNPEKMIAQSSAYKKEHRNEQNRKQREQRKQGRPQLSNRTSLLRRRAKKRKSPLAEYPSDLAHLYRDDESLEHIGNLLQDRCCYCGEPMEHLDHIVPTSKGGPDMWDNLTAACKRCNSQKNNRSLLDFLLYKLEYPDLKDAS